MLKKGWVVILSLLMVFAVACSNKEDASPSASSSAPASSEPPASSAAASPEASPSASEKPLPKVAFVYIGVPGDGGWTYQHDIGRIEMEKEFGIKSTVVENVPEGPDAERVFEDLAKDNDIIIGTSFGYMDSMVAVAERHPDKIFLHNTGYKTAKNLGTYMGREYQSGYLVGMVAGKMTKNNKIGYVAAFPIPEVVYTINAFTLGAQSVNPDIEVSVVWSNTWFDPTVERQAAVSLLDKGVDVLAAYQDSPASIQAAAEKNVWGIGNDSDMSRFAPETYLTNPVWDWGPYYIDTVKKYMDGTWKSEAYWGHMSTGITDIAPFGKNVPQDVKDLVEAKKKEIIDGTFEVFTGPITDASGKVHGEAGKPLSDEEVLSTNWFVKGVSGTIPQ
ncbi:BMP family ABC transporter substrate-binding protein [Cohnella luojiensis]|uniref:BMP family ABC transporter substrate-binding protein n=1 Tax=Cohnella luojiensis TaxID=652876 RepID=A0A4Y8LS23_9BACL|nr:BMP family ABC transporter substrate-binding protein [Cohnella luojiensis]TFE23537.1 BMP family ABC transporter substrate-binding protein [Cohnella luojiensis]